jgi:hypothetical protein
MFSKLLKINASPLKYNDNIVKTTMRDAFSSYNFDNNNNDSISAYNFSSGGTYSVGKNAYCINVSNSRLITSASGACGHFIDDKNSFSISVWIKTTETSSTDKIIFANYGKANLNNRLMYFIYNAYTESIIIRRYNHLEMRPVDVAVLGDVNTSLILSNTIFDGDWHHLVCMYNNTSAPGLFVYVDNIKQEPQAYTYTGVNWGSQIHKWNASMGHDYGFDWGGLFPWTSYSSISGTYTRATPGMIGSLDSLYVFNRVLYPYEIAYLYNYGYGR